MPPDVVIFLCASCRYTCAADCSGDTNLLLLRRTTRSWGGAAAIRIETSAHHSNTTAVSSSAAVLKDFTILLREQLSAEPHGGAAP